MKQKLFNAISKIFQIERAVYLEIEHNTYADERFIPTYNNEKIIGVSISPREDNTLRIFSDIEHKTSYKDVNIQDISEDEMYNLYDNLFCYFLGEDEWGTSQDFLENFVLY